MLAARDAAEAVEGRVRRAAGGRPTCARRSAPSRSGRPPRADNVALDQDFGDVAAVQAAFDAADLVVEQTFLNQRIVNCADGAALGCRLVRRGNGFLHAHLRQPGRPRAALVLAESLRTLPEQQIRLICPDVGGGFGLRNNLYPEQAVIVWAAKRVGRPVKWTNDRSESFLTDYQGRDLVTTARLALTRDGRITAYHVDHVGSVGGQTVTYVPLSNAYRVATTVYDIPLMHMRCRAVMTNTVPTAPFRGAGRPEATLVLERLIDLAAARLGIDRVALRKKNVIRSAASCPTAPPAGCSTTAAISPAT